MYTSPRKASKGSVVVMAERGRLRLQMPRSLYGGARKYLYLGLADTPENRKAAESKAKDIERDILCERFDPTLAKYKPLVHLAAVKKAKPAVTLNDGWEAYTDFKRPSLSPSTLRGGFRPVTRAIAKMPYQDFSEGTLIRDWLMKNYSLYSSSRILVQLSACGDWLVNSGKISHHSFTGLANDIKIPKSHSSKEAEIDPFTREERDLIINAFRTNKYCSKYACKAAKHSNYAAFVEFLFFTGSRPSEAKGLKWEDIHATFILFRQSVVDGEDGFQLKDGLKTQSERKIPINNQLRKIIDEARESSNSEYVFPSPKGEFIDQGNFRTRVWKPLLQAMGIRYRKPYQTRHTFVTLCLDSGIDVKDVSRWVGNSPEIIYKHYAGNKRDLQIPEL